MDTANLFSASFAVGLCCVNNAALVVSQFPRNSDVSCHRVHTKCGLFSVPVLFLILTDLRCAVLCCVVSASVFSQIVA